MIKKIGLIIIVLVALSLFIFKDKLPFNKITSQSEPVSTEKQLTIVSTKPSPLDEATIPPTGGFEITFNKPVAEIKINTTPEDLGYTAEPDINHQTFKITFKKPLELGSGVTFFILTSTHTSDKETLDHEYVYHISTVGYSGV